MVWKMLVVVFAATGSAVGGADGATGAAVGVGMGDGAGIERLGVWCEFLPYGRVVGELPVLREYGCDLILHVERGSFEDPDFVRLLREAERLGVGVDAWLLLPYEEHLYVGQASLGAVRGLALEAADFFEREGLRVRGFVFDCEPSPLLGRELFAAVRRGDVRGLARVLRGELGAEEFWRDVGALNGLAGELRGRGFAVDGAANRAFLDAQVRGNVALEDALNAPVSGVDWDGVSFITYRYGASQENYVAMLNRYAGLARRLYGGRAAVDVGLLGDYDGFEENAVRARLFGGEEVFMRYLRGMRRVGDLEEAVGVVLGCGVRRVNLYALDGMVSSVAGTEGWLRAARGARARSAWGRWTPVRSVQYGVVGALTEKLFRWFTGGSERSHGKIEWPEARVGAGER